MWYNSSHIKANARLTLDMSTRALTVERVRLSMATSSIYPPAKSSKRKQKIECNCAHCGKPFKTSPSRIKRGTKYCSVECANLAQTHKVKCNCDMCGKEIIVKRLRYLNNATGNFCSYECYSKYRKQHFVTFECLNCKKSYSVKPSLIREGYRHFCSRECHRAYSRGDKSPLFRGGKKHYRGQNWPIQRKLAYERDGGVCQCCHRRPRKGERLNAVHHIIPFREFKGDYIAANDLSNLITLCHQCHPKAEHGLIAVPKRLL